MKNKPPTNRLAKFFTLRVKNPPARRYMKIVLQISLFIGLIVGLITIFLLQSKENDFPGVDHSSEYYYCVIENAVYLQQARFGSGIYVTQNGLRHYMVGDWTELFRDLPDVEFLKEYNFANGKENKIEKLYEIKKEIERLRNDGDNFLNLKTPEKRVRIPAFENPYKWKPKEQDRSFEEYYAEAKSSNFENVLFRELGSWQSLWGTGRRIDSSIEYYNKAMERNFE